jgi:hypothetical protein
VTESDFEPEDTDEDALFAKMFSALNAVIKIVKSLSWPSGRPPPGSSCPVLWIDGRELIRRDKAREATTGPPPRPKRLRRPPWKQRAPISQATAKAALGECFPQCFQYSLITPRASRLREAAP